jgi:serine/threonine protein kinase/Tol biopolymer transport system component
MTLERGTLLHRRYRIVEILGQGGMGSVYRAVDENLGVDVALKENLFTTDEYARQFRLEAVILANLRHPNLPRVSDHFVVGEQGQYLVMDFIEGEDLRQRMERQGMITDDDATQIGAAMCDALNYLHSRKPSILHRDIKPGNVKITPDGHIFLVDFGLAKVVQGSQVTTTGARAMTPGYSPPEQYGTARTDPRTDVYSLGATLYAAVCGIIPEDGLARAMENAELTPLRKRNPKTSRRLSAVIEKAMAVDPADRYQNAEEFKRALLNSKSRTQQLTGSYTVTPPPMDMRPEKDHSEAQTAVESRQNNGQKKNGFLMEEDEQPFVPPGKKKKEQRKRRQRSLLFFMVLLLIVMVGAVYFVPDLLPVQARSMFAPYLPPVVNNTATATAQPSATALLETPTLTTVGLETEVSTETVTEHPDVTDTVTATLPPTPTLDPAATPQGGGPGEIAFASMRTGVSQIYISDLQGLTIRPITNLPEGACQPSWSPDGQKLVFVSPCKGNLIISAPPPANTSLYMINADGTELKQLSSVPGADFEPRWSPDGERIAFTSIRDGNMQVYVLNLADEEVTRLTFANLFGSDSDAEARQASWSPFGNQLLLAVKRVGAYQVWVITDTGQSPQQIVRSGQTYWDYLPVWSRDGKAILFSERRAGTFSQPWVMSILYENRDSVAANEQNLGNLPIEDLRFSPDGYWLVFEGEQVLNNTDIFYANVTGGVLTRLTSDPSPDFDPAWRPIQIP